MTLYGFSSEVARPLVEIARERITRPHIRTRTTLPTHTFPALRAYILHPQGTIGAAVKCNDTEGGNEVRLGSGNCWIVRRNKDGKPNATDLIYQRDDNDNRVSVVAYNLCDEEIVGGGDVEADASGSASGSGDCDTTGLVYAVQDTFGDLYIVDRCTLECESCSSSSSSSSSSSASSSASLGSPSSESGSPPGSEPGSGSPSEGSGSEEPPCVSDRITVSGEPRLESVDSDICGSGQEHEEVWRLVIPKLTLFTEDGCLRSEDAGEFSALICCCQEPGSSSSSSSGDSGSDEPNESSSASSSSSSSSSSSCGDCPADIAEPTRFNSCSVDADGFHLGWDFDPDENGDCYSFDVEGSFDDSSWDRLVTETKNKSNDNPGEGDACWNDCCASPAGNTDSGPRHFYFNPPISPFYSFFRVRAVCDADTSQTSDWTHLIV